MNRFASLLSIFLLFCASARADFIRIEENHPSVSYTGSWTPREGATLSGGRLLVGTLGSTATVTFNGTGIHWIEYFHEDARGGANIYLDGVLMGFVYPRDCCVIDVYGEKQLRHAISGLADTTHILTIEGTGAPFSFSPLITLDAFYVERGSISQLIQESDTAAITYTGTWLEFDDPSVSGGSVLASREAGATATVHYTGSAISWLSYLCPCAAGIATITWPNNNNVGATRNAYASERRAQAIIYNRVEPTGAAPERQLTIEVTGDSVVDNPWVVIDAFRVQTGSSDGPDTTPPEITIRAPQDGATISGRLPVVSDVFDNEDQHGVNVRYFVDDVEIPRDVTQRVTKLTFDTWLTTAGEGPDGNLVTPLTNGPHVLTAVARDSAGNETRSAPVNVIVNNTTPIVVMRVPSSPLTGVVTIRAETSLDFNTAAGVTFWARGSDNTVYNLGSDTTAPYSIDRDTSSIPSGRSFSLWVEIFDLSGNSVTSQPKLVHISH